MIRQHLYDPQCTPWAASLSLPSSSHPSRRFPRIPLLLLLLLSVVLLCLTPIGHAQPLPQQQPQHLEVAVTLQNLANIDLQAGQCDVDLLISLWKTDGTRFNGVQPELINAARFVRTDNNSVPEKFFRVLTTFYFKVHNKNFPFDAHKIGFMFYVPGYTLSVRGDDHPEAFSGVLDQIQTNGWTIEKWNIETVELDTFAAGSRYAIAFQVDIERPVVKAFVTVLLPPIFILVSQLASFSIPVTEAITRLTLSGSSLVAAVMFHANLAIPFTSFLTFIDKFMVIEYFLLVMAVVINVIIVVLRSKAEAERFLHKLHKIVEYSCWIVAPAFFLLLFLPWYFFLLLLILPPFMLLLTAYFTKSMRKKIREIIHARRLRSESMLSFSSSTLDMGGAGAGGTGMGCDSRSSSRPGSALGLDDDHHLMDMHHHPHALSSSSYEDGEEHGGGGGGGVWKKLTQNFRSRRRGNSNSFGPRNRGSSVDKVIMSGSSIDALDGDAGRATLQPPMMQGPGLLRNNNNTAVNMVSSSATGNSSGAGVSAAAGGGAHEMEHRSLLADHSDQLQQQQHHNHHSVHFADILHVNDHDHSPPSAFIINSNSSNGGSGEQQS